MYWRADAVDAEGRVLEAMLGNGVSTTRTFDPATGLVRTIQSGLGDISGVQDLGYVFDSLGNLTTREDFIQDVYESFAYDRLNRVTGSTVHDADDDTGRAARTYRCDAIGNIVNKSDVGAADYVYGTGRARTVQVRTRGAAVTMTVYVAGLFEKVSETGKPTRSVHYVFAGSQRVAIRTTDDAPAPSKRVDGRNKSTAVRFSLRLGLRPDGRDRRRPHCCHPGLDPGPRPAPDADPGEAGRERCLWPWAPDQVRGDNRGGQGWQMRTHRNPCPDPADGSVTLLHQRLAPEPAI